MRTPALVAGVRMCGRRLPRLPEFNAIDIDQ
jgi:hypothetical protein